MAAVNPFMMDDPPTVANPFGGSAASINPFLDAAPVASNNSSSAGAASNPFLMDAPSDPDLVPSNAYNPFAAVSTAGPNDVLDWLSSGGAMQTQDATSPYDIPNAAAAPLDDKEQLSLDHMDHMDQHLDSSLGPLDDLLDVELPVQPDELSLDLPTEEYLDAPLMTVVTDQVVQEAVTPSPSRSRPPPPPRPPTRPSPPHETQQLILSVTGAMQVTIYHYYYRCICY